MLPGRGHETPGSETKTITPGTASNVNSGLASAPLALNLTGMTTKGPGGWPCNKAVGAAVVL